MPGKAPAAVRPRAESRPLRGTRRRISPSPRLALDGEAVRRIIGPASGPHVGEALRWLQSQVDENPELNTSAALTAVLRFWPARPVLTRPPAPGLDGPRSAPTGTTLRIAVEEPAQPGQRARLTAEGEVDLANRRELAAAVDRARRDAPGGLDVDLRFLDFIDGAGMRELVQAARRGGGAQVRLVVAPGSVPHRVAELLAVRAHLPVRVVERSSAGARGGASR